jgi:hypothetical protein
LGLHNGFDLATKFGQIHASLLWVDLPRLGALTSVRS